MTTFIIYTLTPGEDVVNSCHDTLPGAFQRLEEIVRPSGEWLDTQVITTVPWKSHHRLRLVPNGPAVDFYITQRIINGLWLGTPR